MNCSDRISVRTGRGRDLDAIVEIERTCFADPWSREALAVELQSDDLRLPLVAAAGDDVVGYLLAWRVVDQLHVLNIAVLGAYRRAGVGTALLNAAAHVAASNGLQEITLEVRRGNRAARAFYERHGFQQLGVRSGYYPDTGEDALILTSSVAALLPETG